MHILKKHIRLLDNVSGLALIELIIAVAILGIIMVGLSQVMGTALSVYESTSEKQDIIAQARFAMDRIVMFTQETDDIQIPTSEKLIISERLMDTYDEFYVYVPGGGGDGYLDADNDRDGAVNEGGGDPLDPITFEIDKTNGNNWKLREQMPDYSTSGVSDFVNWTVLCEHLSGVTFTTLGTNLLQIELAVEDGKSSISLMTRVMAMYED